MNVRNILVAFDWALHGCTQVINIDQLEATVSARFLLWLPLLSVLSNFFSLVLFFFDNLVSPTISIREILFCIYKWIFFSLRLLLFRWIPYSNRFRRVNNFVKPKRWYHLMIYFCKIANMAHQCCGGYHCTLYPFRWLSPFFICIIILYYIVCSDFILFNIYVQFIDIYDYSDIHYKWVQSFFFQPLRPYLCAEQFLLLEIVMIKKLDWLKL